MSLIHLIFGVDGTLNAITLLGLLLGPLLSWYALVCVSGVAVAYWTPATYGQETKLWRALCSGKSAGS